MTRNKLTKIFVRAFPVVFISTIVLLLGTQYITLASGRDTTDQHDPADINLTNLDETGTFVYMPLVMSMISCANADFDSQFLGEAECWVFNSGVWDVDSEHLYTGFTQKGIGIGISIVTKHYTR